jgi:hypothetical protein
MPHRIAYTRQIIIHNNKSKKTLNVATESKNPTMMMLPDPEHTPYPGERKNSAPQGQNPQVNALNRRTKTEIHGGR